MKEANNVMSTFRFRLDDGVRKNLAHLATGKEINQTLVNQIWDIVIAEIRNTCDEHNMFLTDNAVVWLAESYFKKAIKLKSTESSDVLGTQTTSNNDVNIALLSAEDVGCLLQHLKGSIFESELLDESKKRTIERR